MHKHMYLEVGLKLLGVYVAILGVGALANVLVSFMMPMQADMKAAQLGAVLFSKLLRLATPLAYFAVAVALTRNTAACVRWCMADQ